MALNHLTIYSQFLSRICAATGVKPIIERAFLLRTEEPPAFEKALPREGIPPNPPPFFAIPPYVGDSVSELAS